MASRNGAYSMTFEDSVKQTQLRRERKALFYNAKGLVETIVLLLVILTTLSGGCTLAFTFSSRITKTLPFAPYTKDGYGGHERRILGRIRNREDGYGCTRMQPRGIQNSLHQGQKKLSSVALFSTTEKRANEDTTTTSFLSSSKLPAVVTTTFTTTNTTESTEATLQKKKNSKDIYHHTPKVPRHVGLICDGNGRWATQRNLPRAAGHLEGARRLVDLIKSLLKERKEATPDEPLVNCITLYAFSTENWSRSPMEISKIFEAIEFAASAVLKARELSEIDLKILGDLSDDRIPVNLKKLLSEMKEKTVNHQSEENASNEKRLQICLAINYGGRRDIVSACRSLAEDLRDGKIDSVQEITEEALQQKLSTGQIEPPDLIVRTGGEYRLSNFLLWEAAYAELCVSQVLWPDFSWEGEWKKSLEWYSKRKRNFGGREE